MGECCDWSHAVKARCLDKLGLPGEVRTQQARQDCKYLKWFITKHEKIVSNVIMWNYSNCAAQANTLATAVTEHEIPHIYRTISFEFLQAQLALLRQLWTVTLPSPLGFHTSLSPGCRAHHWSLAPQTQPTWGRKQKDKEDHNHSCLILHWHFRIVFSPFSFELN